MNIQEFTTYHESSPVLGYGVWIVIGRENGSVHLLHPVALSELHVSEYEFRQNSGATLWPVNNSGIKFNASRFSEAFKHRILFFLENERSFPIQTAAKALAEFEEISLKEALDFIGKNSLDEDGNFKNRVVDKANREFKLTDKFKVLMVYGRKRVILQAFLDHGPASIQTIISLVDGKLVTKSDQVRVVTYLINNMAAQGILEIVS
jgi:hypothetical protein